MQERNIAELLHNYKAGRVSEAEAIARIGQLPFEDMGFAMVDHHREMRQGFPEVIYGAGKTSQQILAIMKSLREHSSGSVLATRVSPEKAAYVLAELPESIYEEIPQLLYIKGQDDQPVDEQREILVVTAGTSDMPVAEEARITAWLHGNKVSTCYDCGVAGLHRIVAHMPEIRRANVIIVIAGMEGALASVIGGLTRKPVIAVPTSVGYGASFHGVAALLSMLNSCASGVSVVNIDNGFGAGVLASKINHMR